MSVTVVSCVYGERGYERFVPRWAEHIAALNTRPDHVIVAGDCTHDLPAFVKAIVKPCPWLHPQAFYLQEAINAAPTDWVWIVDIDDRAMPDALDGIDEVAADVWAVGYTSVTDTYVPPAFTAEEVLAASTSVIPAGSAIRTEAFRRCGGFRDVAFQDWALWRSLAETGATFASSGRVGYRYRRHDIARTAVELTSERRAGHLAEMMAAENVPVAA
jgi:hypothetical protein